MFFKKIAWICARKRPWLTRKQLSKIGLRTLRDKKRSQSEQNCKFWKNYLQCRWIFWKTLWSGDPASLQHYERFVEEKFRSKYKHLISFKKWNKNSQTSYTSKNICISSNFFRYFFEGTPFLRRGRQFIEFSPKSRRFALASGKISESQRKKICKRAEVPPKSLSKQNSKNKKNDQNEELWWFFSMLLKNFAQKKNKYQINPANSRIYKNFYKQ